MTVGTDVLPATLRAFITEQVATRQCILALDYDGTLAPFHEQRDRAIPPPHVQTTLASLAGESATELVIVSGRPVEEVDRLLHLQPRPELWGVHGWEHLDRDGRREEFALPALMLAVLDAEEARLLTQLERDRVERKSASIAVHWRGLHAEHAAAIESAVRTEWERIAGPAGLSIRAFDGGIELRAPGRDKGSVIRALLERHGEEVPLLYIGDDDTDEDAFRALLSATNGLGVRAEDQSAPTLARLVVHTSMVTVILDAWLAATRRAAAQAT